MLGVSSGLITPTSVDGAAATTTPPPPAAPAAVAESGGSSEGGGDVAVGGGFSEEGERNSGGNRWPRQETLALLRIRSEMDVIFRDSSLKGPLWEEVSRKLADLGYHRSAKKCKEKFENVYKYHRRTKDGRASKADGKTYRFFDQLQALENNPSHSLPPPPLAATPLTMAMPMRGNATTNIPPVPMSQSSPAPSTQNPFTISQNTTAATAGAAPIVNHPNLNISSLSMSQQPPTAQPTTNTLNHQINHPHEGNNIFSNSTSSSSSTSSDEDIQRRRGKKRKWKDLFERLMKDVMVKQEELHMKFLETLEKRERERMVREETWRVQEMARMNREHDLLVQERSMAAAKDATIIAFLQKITEQKNIQIPISTITNTTSPTQIQLQLPEKALGTPPLNSQPQQQTPAPSSAPPTPAPAPAIAVSLPMTIHTPIPTQALSLPVAIKTLETPKNDNGGEHFTPASSSRWPKEEIEALIRLRTCLDLKYQDNGPKGPLWEEISAGMRRIGYNRNAKRCKEKWENINKYYKKVKESNKKRPEDSKTCPYFHQLEALYKEKAKNEAVTNTGTGFGLKPENNPIAEHNPMAVIMAQPEQQWPLQPQQQQQQVQGMNVNNIIQDHENESDSMDHDDDDEYDDEDEEDEGDAYEIVTNKQPSSMAAAATTTTAATTAV